MEKPKGPDRFCDLEFTVDGEEIQERKPREPREEGDEKDYGKD